jgi:predicted DNA-binding protein
MSDPKNAGVKTLGIRLPDELHAQFALVAQLDGLSLTDAIRRAVELYVEGKQSEADFAARAQQALEEIEREATARRNAITALFGQTRQTGEAGETGKPTARRKSGGTEQT